MATKRALRAILKAVRRLRRATPERVAKAVVDERLARDTSYALEVIKDVPYGRWREYDAEDTLRFYALRLREAG